MRTMLLLLLALSLFYVACHAPPPPTEIVSTSLRSAPAPVAQRTLAQIEEGKPVLLGRAPRDELRPPARGTQKLRERAVVEQEIGTMEALAVVSRPRPGASPNAQLMKGLAESYVELSLIARREGDESATWSARKKAHDEYALLERQHPGYAGNDEILLFLANVTEQVDSINAKYTYQSLIQRHPRSPLLPAAWLGLGEAQLLNGPSLPEAYKDALDAYEHVLAFPSPNACAPYAAYKLAWTWLRLGRRAQAKEAFNRAISVAREEPNAPNAALIADAASSDRDVL